MGHRVGDLAARGGRLLAIGRRVLAAGQPLSAMHLPLTTEPAVSAELEPTDSRAVADVNLE